MLPFYHQGRDMKDLKLVMFCRVIFVCFFFKMYLSTLINKEEEEEEKKKDKRSLQQDSLQCV